MFSNLGGGPERRIRSYFDFDFFETIYFKRDKLLSFLFAMPEHALAFKSLEK